MIPTRQLNLFKWQSWHISSISV